jgi:hypothetical protein
MHIASTESVRPARRFARRRVGAAHLAAAVTSVVLVACDGPEPSRPTDPVPAAPQDPPSYDEEERAVYRQALRRVRAFEAANQEVLAVGRASPRAKRLYQDNLRSWRPSYRLLQANQRDGIRVQHGPAVLGVRATSIKSFQDNAAEVVLLRCIDRSAVRMTRRGVPVPSVRSPPVAQQVVVYRSENRTWTIQYLPVGDRTCAQ